MLKNKSKNLANKIRVNSLQMVHRAKASHIGSALSIADIVAVLYSNILRIDPNNDKDKNRDRFILSKGHACVAVYSALYEIGFVTEKEVKTYGEDFSLLMNHISHNVPGVEFSTGALGHGLPFAVGKALATKIRKEDWRVFVLLSDGEMDEGSNWEALMFASHHKLSNLTAIIDYNNLQSLDSVSNTLALEPLKEKLVAFGCNVQQIDGHDHNALHSSFKSQAVDMPTVIIANTKKGKGVSFMENKVKWHYKNPNDQEFLDALSELEKNFA